MWIGVGKGKGGAGCTTSVLELAYAASRRTKEGRPRRVAVLDLDPQGSASDALEPESRRIGIKDALRPDQPVPLADVLVPTAWDGVLLAPADRFLANREADLTAEGIASLRRARLAGDLDGLVDDVVLDLPREVGKIATAGLLSVEHLFIVARATLWGAQGAEEMRYTADRISGKANPELKIAGYIVTAFEDISDSRRILEAMRQQFGNRLLDPPIPRIAEVSESLESYHTPCREFGGRLTEIADIYQRYYDGLQEAEENTR